MPSEPETLLDLVGLSGNQMQIHEVFTIPAAAAGLGAKAKAMAKNPGSLINPTKYGQAQQAGYAASADKSAQKLRAQGYGQEEAVPGAGQLVAQVRSSQPVQQLVNSWATQWPKLASNIPQPAPASPAPAPASPAPAAQSLDLDQLKQQSDQKRAAGIAAQSQALQQMKSTSDANVAASTELASIEKAARDAAAKSKFQQTATDRLAIKRAKDRGIKVESVSLKEQESADSTYRAAFVSWADGVVERTTKQSGAIARIKNKPEWAQEFKTAIDNVISSVGDSEKNSQAVKEYLFLAVAAARAAHQQPSDAAPRQQSGVSADLGDSNADALAQAIGLNSAGIAKLNAFMRRTGETINPQGTGSKTLDALLRAARLLK